MGTPMWAYLRFETRVHADSGPVSREAVAVPGSRPFMLMSKVLRPFQLALNPAVDRSCCAEFQLLDKVATDLLLLRANGKSPQGAVCLVVMGSPCLSCACVLRQFQIIFQGVDLRVSFGRSLPYRINNRVDYAT